MHVQTTGRRRARLPFLVAGALVAVLALALGAAGGVALWADGQKDATGFIATDAHHFAAEGSALVSEEMDVDLDGAEQVVEEDNLGEMRLEVASTGGEPVFVGVAREDDVRDYLDGVAHATVTDLEYDPFRVDYAPHAGDRRPSLPAAAGIWAASAMGSGSQTLEWEVGEGDWSVVVMNADGSAGVDAEVAAGVKLPWLEPAGWGTLGGGALLLAGAGMLLLVAFRRPGDRSGGGTTVPATAPPVVA